MRQDDDKNLEVGREWISRSFANFVYGISVFILFVATVFVFLGIGEKSGHGSRMALEIFVFTKMLPVAVVALLFTVRMASPRWTKALVPVILWFVMAVALSF